MQTSRHEMLANLTEATQCLESFIAQADRVSKALVEGVSPEALKEMCETLLTEAEKASQINSTFTEVTHSDEPDLAELESQRQALVLAAQHKNQVIDTVLAALIKQTSSQMQALKSAMANTADTYSASGKPTPHSASRTLSKA